MLEQQSASYSHASLVAKQLAQRNERQVRAQQSELTEQSALLPPQRGDRQIPPVQLEPEQQSALVVHVRPGARHGVVQTRPLHVRSPQQSREVVQEPPLVLHRSRAQVPDRHRPEQQLPGLLHR